MDFEIDVKPLYEKMKKEFDRCSYSDNVTECFKNLYEKNKLFLDACDTVELTSKVEGKEYFLFTYGKAKSRAINKKLFNADLNSQSLDYSVDQFWDNVKANQIAQQSTHDIIVALYVVAISFCASVDLLNAGDRQSSGTYFERLIGHLYSKKFGIIPSNKLEVLNIGSRPTLPTDYIFDLGDQNPKFHVPIKTSTRERVLQAWSHQKVLDGVYGIGRFVGLLNCLAETKVDRKKLEVTEICLPEQWQIYQSFIARLTRIYYLDIPNAYKKLNDIFPRIHVKELGEFFHENYELME